MSTAPARTRSNAAVGLTIFAATIMIMVGSFQAIQGIVALANDTFYVVGPKYVFQFDVTTWGWIHLLLGTLLVDRWDLPVPRRGLGAHGGSHRRRPSARWSTSRGCPTTRFGRSPSSPWTSSSSGR